MRHFLYIVVTIGYALAFVRVLLPDFCILLPFHAWVLMAVCGLIALVCGKSAGRLLPLLAMLAGLAGSVYAYRFNCRKIEVIREHLHKSKVPFRELMQPTETNMPSNVPPNQLTS